MANRSRWSLTPGRWLALKLATVVPLVYFLGRMVLPMTSGEIEFWMVIPTGLILLDGLVTRWTYARQSRTA